jgi:hypothetical protein
MSDDTTTKTEFIENRTVDGIDFMIFRTERFTYSGQWERSGYLVVCPDKKTGGSLDKKTHLYGWPVDTDLKRIYNDP